MNSIATALSKHPRAADSLPVGIGIDGGGSHCRAWVFNAKGQVLGQGQFRPLTGSQPFLGSQGALESVAEWKVEMVVADELIHAAVKALRQSHPYETPAFEVWRLSDLLL